MEKLKNNYIVNLIVYTVMPLVLIVIITSAIMDVTGAKPKTRESISGFVGLVTMLWGLWGLVQAVKISFTPTDRKQVLDGEGNEMPSGQDLVRLSKATGKMFKRKTAGCFIRGVVGIAVLIGIPLIAGRLGLVDMKDSLHPIVVILLCTLVMCVCMEFLRGLLYNVGSGSFNKGFKRLLDGDYDEREYYDNFLIESWMFLKTTCAEIKKLADEE